MSSQWLDEVEQATRVVDRVGEILNASGVDTITYHDTVSDDKSENLNRICNFHNSKTRDLDVSVHFNASGTGGVGTEVWYVTQDELASEVSQAIAEAGGFKNRGPKYTSNLFFLNSTEQPAVLLEICFGDVKSDCDRYYTNFEAICHAVAQSLAGRNIGETPPIEPPEQVTGVVTFTGKMSVFGGPDDTGVDSDEGLAMYSNVDQKPELFLDFQPSGTSGLARRLNPSVYYVACRWDYNQTSKEYLRTAVVDVSAEGADGRKRTIKAYVADWGPHGSTGRASDLSPGLAAALGLDTNDICTVTVPLPKA
jgi:N-acetylmuramoyl-L-alanine amidase